MKHFRKQKENFKKKGILSDEYVRDSDLDIYNLDSKENEDFIDKKQEESFFKINSLNQTKSVNEVKDLILEMRQEIWDLKNHIKNLEVCSLDQITEEIKKLTLNNIKPAEIVIQKFDKKKNLSKEKGALFASLFAENVALRKE